MKFLGINEDTISKADYQLQKINLVDRVNKMNTEKFWSEVGDYKDASGLNPFLELYQCAISVLILPHLNPEIVGSVVEWLKRRARVQHSLDSKPTRAILLCPWERHFSALSLLVILASSFKLKSYIY